MVHVYYGFGDALGKQFGVTLSESYGYHWYCIGLWTATEEEESSNYKELRNLVDTVLEEAGAGRLRD
jgi:hypothetical protein